MFKNDDLEEVLGLANRFAFFDRAATESDFEKSSSFKEGFWVAEEDNKLIGFVFGFIRDIPSDVLEQWNRTKVAEIDLLAVDSEYRKRGVGRSLVQKLIDEFRKAGVDRILLTCPAEAIDAKNLYDEMGFEIRAHHMKLDLT